MQLAADISTRAEQIVELLRRADGRLYADELDGEAPPGQGSAQREPGDRYSQGWENRLIMRW